MNTCCWYITTKTFSRHCRRLSCRQCAPNLCNLAYEINSDNKCIEAAPLYSTSTGTCVRVRYGETVITDGPFAETREQLGGYYLVNAENLDEAVAFASRISSARTGSIEVRPVAENPHR